MFQVFKSRKFAGVLRNIRMHSNARVTSSTILHDFRASRMFWEVWEWFVRFSLFCWANKHEIEMTFNKLQMKSKAEFQIELTKVLPLLWLPIYLSACLPACLPACPTAHPAAHVPACMPAAPGYCCFWPLLELGVHLDLTLASGLAMPFWLHEVFEMIHVLFLRPCENFKKGKHKTRKFQKRTLKFLQIA